MFRAVEAAELAAAAHWFISDLPDQQLGLKYSLGLGVFRCTCNLLQSRAVVFEWPALHSALACSCMEGSSLDYTQPDFLRHVGLCVHFSPSPTSQHVLIYISLSRMRWEAVAVIRT